MSERIRVILWYRVPTEERDDVGESYRKISEGLVGTPGMLGNELLRSRDQDDVLVVTSFWESSDHLLAWVHSTSHRSTSPLRPYLDTARDHPYEVFDVVSAF